MRICFYSPYIPKHFGGGEKHLLDVAVSASRFHQVFLAVPAPKMEKISLEKIKTEYQNFFGDDLSKIEVITSPLGSAESFLNKLNWTRQFDGIYYVTDGSLFFSGAKHNYLHVQIPFKSSKNSVIERLKLSNWPHKNSNSFFTKSVIESSWKTRIDEVIHPLVDLEQFATTVPKEKIILNVGRFFKHLHAKRQDVLIDCFRQLNLKLPRLMKDWQLVLVGAVEDNEYVKELQQMVGSANVRFIHSINRKELIKLYQSASFYWHATGYEVDEHLFPEKVEHFGISTVEAMAAGAIPVVHYKGGQKEILDDELRQLGWTTKEECVSKTAELISNVQQAKTIRHISVSRAEAFSKVKFDKKIETLFSV